MDNSDSNIDTEFLKYFKPEKYDKNKYDWNIISVSKDNQNSRSVYCGVNKEDKNDCIYVKQFKLFFSFNKNNEISQILKEIYFLILLKNQKYFVNINDIFFDEDYKRLFLEFKGNCVSLNKLINYKANDYLSNNDLIKWIIYQISFGLYILHYNNIIHNDIKPSNLLIDEEGGITICDFGSASYNNKESYSYTRYYTPPEFLNNTNLIRDEKSDMWALGVIIVELYLKKNRYFKSDDEEKTIENQLKFIFAKFGMENIQKEDINRIINDNINSDKYKLKDEEIENQIKDKDAIDLINNLLVLNPEKRYTALKVLKSKYLTEFNDIDSYDVKINDFIIDYETLNDIFIDKDKFMNIIGSLKSRI